MTLRAFFLLLLFAVYPANALGAGKTAVAIRLATPNPDVCVGQTGLPLEAVLTNTSKHTVDINPVGVNSGLRILEYKQGGVEQRVMFIADLIQDQITRGIWLKIAPGQSVVVPFTEPFSGFPDFEKFSLVPGIFSIEILFAEIDKDHSGAIQARTPGPSNKVMFRIVHCANGVPADAVLTH